MIKIGDNVRYLFFDFDGVIVQTEDVKFLAYKKAFQELYSVDLPDSVSSWKGLPEQEVIEFWNRHLSLKTNIKALISKKREIYQDLTNSTPPKLTSGVKSFLIEAQSLPIGLALVTGSANVTVQKILKRLELSNFFDPVITLNDVSNPKPAPQPYIMALKRANVRPEEAIVFEDSPAGVQSAISAGIHCIGVLSNYSAHKLGPVNGVISDFTKGFSNQLITIRPEET